MAHNPTHEELTKFWNTYVGDSNEIHASAITQIFVWGPFAGHSIREVMELASRILGKKLPTIVVGNDWDDWE